MPSNSNKIFSIGHSNHDYLHFVHLLKAHVIDVVVDIRSAPYSRYANQYNKEYLAAALREQGVRYLFLGKELGGRPEESHCYDAEGHVLYGVVAELPSFKEGIARLQRGMENYRIVLLCSEEDPSHCHRHLLVSRVLSAEKVEVEHIRGDGHLISDEQLQKLNYIQPSMFKELDLETWKSSQSVLQRRQPPNSSSS